MKKNKYRYLFIVQGYFRESPYNNKWEDLCCSEDKKEAYTDLKCYKQNDNRYLYRLIRRRAANE